MLRCMSGIFVLHRTLYVLAHVAASQSANGDNPKGHYTLSSFWQLHITVTNQSTSVALVPSPKGKLLNTLWR
jgi:hypothetical protein